MSKKQPNNKENDKNEYIGNVFVVSRLGQIRNVENFIKQYEAKKNILIIQHSDTNKYLLKNMIESCDKSLYTEILYLELPNRALSPTKKKNMYIYKTMLSKIKYINKNYYFNNLFLCNADKWWSFYEKIKNEYKFTYKINLLEEGLTTYIVSYDPNYKDETNYEITMLDVKNSLVEFLKHFKIAMVKLASLILNFISVVLRFNVIYKIRCFINDKTMEEKYKFSYINHFDEAIVCFPEKLIPNNFKIDKVKKLNFKFGSIDKERYKSSFNPKYALFINQQYVNYVSHFKIIFDILEEMNINQLYIKFHPKENKDKVLECLNEELKRRKNFTVEVLTNFDSVPIENIINAFKFKKVIGLTSSSLMYCNELIKGLDVVSIAERYKEKCSEKRYGVRFKEMNLYNKEYKRFVEISGVKQFKKEGEKNEKTKSNSGNRM